MTDRIEGFSVVLDQRVRDDDAEGLRAAIAQLRGVATVSPVVSTGEAYFAEVRTRGEIVSRLLDFIEREVRGTPLEKGQV
jgi:hypothetical protein